MIIRTNKKILGLDLNKHFIEKSRFNFTPSILLNKRNIQYSLINVIFYETL